MTLRTASRAAAVAGLTVLLAGLGVYVRQVRLERAYDGEPW